MNQATVVRVDVDASGAKIRLWIDDENGRHVTVAELVLGRKALRAWAVESDDLDYNEGQQRLC
jgi:hypothetical protein